MWGRLTAWPSAGKQWGHEGILEKRPASSRVFNMPRISAFNQTQFLICLWLNREIKSCKNYFKKKTTRDSVQWVIVPWQTPFSEKWLKEMLECIELLNASPDLTSRFDLHGLLSGETTSVKVPRGSKPERCALHFAHETIFLWAKDGKRRHLWLQVIHREDGNGKLWAGQVYICTSVANTEKMTCRSEWDGH